MSEVLREAASEPETLRTAPHRMPVRRLDDVRAARELDLAYRPAP
jgi:glycine dehydrogenase subunit 2